MFPLERSILNYNLHQTSIYLFIFFISALTPFAVHYQEIRIHLRQKFNQ